MCVEVCLWDWSFEKRIKLWLDWFRFLILLYIVVYVVYGIYFVDYV